MSSTFQNAEPTSGNPGPVTTVDVAIIGLGSAGEALAQSLLSSGLRVVGFEPGFVGGECPFTACMPSKALLHEAHLPGERTSDAWRRAVAHRDDVAADRNDDEHASNLIDQGIILVRSRAEITGEGRVVADGATWVAEHVVIATGSAAVYPPIEGLDPERSWTAEDALTDSDLPASMIIIGAGAIGCELGDVYHRFGSTVTVLEANVRLLPGLDAEVADLYATLLRADGLDLRLSAEVSKVEYGDGCTVRLGDGSSLHADRLLVAAGQAPRVDGLGLDSIGLEDGKIPEFDASFTNPEHSWLHLIGDVNGQSPWTHGANREAAILSSVIVGRTRKPMPGAVPHAVFTDPPVAHVGSSIEAHEATGHRGVRGVGRPSDVARHSTDRLGDGLVVLTIDADSGVVVGGSAVGPLADEMIATITSWVHLEATIEQAADQVFAFPTIAQVVEVAAANGLEAWRKAGAG